MTPLPYTITSESMSVIFQGRSYTVRKGTPNFARARDAAINEDWDTLVPLLSAGLAIDQWIGGDFRVENNLITYKGEPIDQTLNQRLLKMATEGANPASWLKFWERLQANPSYRSVHQLYQFLTHQGIPIDEDGFLLAYKSVTSDFKDFHTRTVDNQPGVTNVMPRNKISDDPQVACHEGFHVGALEYARSFGQDDKRIVICKVDPADVVCVPYDASYMKMRVCRYTVLGNYSGEPLPDTVYTEKLPTIPSLDDETEDDEDYDEDYDETEDYDEDYDETEDDEDYDETEDVEDYDETEDCDVEATPSDNKWVGNAPLHHLLRSKEKGGWGLRQFEVCRRTGLDSGYLSRVARGVGTLGTQAVTRILEAFPEAFASDWSKYAEMDRATLLAQDEATLRQYATEGLFIVSINQIKSMTSLVDRILQVRRGTQ